MTNQLLQMPYMNNIEVKGWCIKTEPLKLFFFSDANTLVSLENTFIPLSHESYTVSQNNSSGIKCSDEFGEHAHQN